MKNNRHTKHRRHAGNKPEVQMRVHQFANPNERQEFLINLAISSEFEMRYRGLLEYYGKEFIAYKQLEPSDKKRNEFLRIMSKFMTDCLEDKCPSAWQRCEPSFWEELLFTFYPHSMKISSEEKEVENFLSQIKKFVMWLDKRVGTSWYSIVEEYSDLASSELKSCEHLLNGLFLNDFPRIYFDDWGPEQDIERINHQYAQCTDTLSSIFEVTSIIEDTVVLTEFDTNRTYYIKGLPYKLVKIGMIMSGIIGKKRGELTWNWYQTDGIYPQRGKNYLTLKQVTI